VKRFIRLSLRVALGLVGLIAALLLLALDGVDSRPYLRAPYYAETTTQLHARIATNRVAQAELSAGFGRVRLTPTVNTSQDDPAQGQFRDVPLAGYGDRAGKPAPGVHDDLFVKAVALKVGDRLGVMASADALIIPAEVSELAARRLAQELKLSREQLYLSATHTHASLGGWGEGPVAEAFAGAFQPGVRVWFADRIVAAVREAVGDLQPAAFGHGRFTAREFVRNRLVGELGRVDPEFSFAILKQPGGRTAVLGSYAAHATVLSSDMMEFSADWPGCWQQAVEQATGGLAVFLAGGMGSHSPVPAERGFAGAQRMGQALATTLLEQLPGTLLTNRITFGIVGIDVTLPPLNVRVTDGLRLRPWIARRLLHARERSFLQAFRLDDLLWLSTPCDFSGELALDLKDAFRACGADAAITSFNGDYVGYVIPSRYYHLSGYEPRLMSFFGPNVPDYFEDVLRTMALSLWDR
jgi:hypothetical protein